jgi:uncharacterized protein YdeI (YjbR/CyaY-like superfamily)
MVDLELLHCESPEDWETWLEEHHASSKGVYLMIAKKGSAHVSPSYAEALDVALCFGWIDGKKMPHSGDFFLQRFTPRRPASLWSQINRKKVEALIEAGRMRPRGFEEIERAKADGRWDAAYAPVSEAVPAPDLQAALDANPEAAAFFATLDRTNRFAVMFRVQNLKTPEARARRITQYVEMLARGETLYPIPETRRKKQPD